MTIITEAMITVGRHIGRIKISDCERTKESRRYTGLGSEVQFDSSIPGKTLSLLDHYYCQQEEASIYEVWY